LFEVVVEVALIATLNIRKASLIVVSGPTTLLLCVFLRMAVLLLTDVALGL
jgi:hypothetical protein